MRRAFLVGLVTLLFGILYAQVPAFAHNWNLCGDGGAIKWTGGTTSESYPSTWADNYKNAILDSRTNINGNSHFKYQIASPHGREHALVQSRKF